MHNTGQPVGYQQITLTGTAAALTVPIKAQAMLVRVSTANARIRTDGTAPTATVGFPLVTTDTTPLWFEGRGNLTGAQLIAQTGSPVVDILYFATQ